MNIIKNICDKCRAANEPPPNIPHNDPAIMEPPPGFCPVCWFRYGKCVQACRPASTITTQEMNHED